MKNPLLLPWSDKDVGGIKCEDGFVEIFGGDRGAADKNVGLGTKGGLGIEGHYEGKLGIEGDCGIGNVEVEE